MNNILIIGGGYAGIAAAKKLAKNFKKNDDVSITLVDKRPFHTLMTELHEVAGHRVEPDSVRIPYAKIFGVSKVQVKMDSITGIDFKKKEAKSETGTYPYDYLVLGAGAEPEFFGIAGIRENSFTLWSYDDAMKLRFHVDDIFEKAVAEPDPKKRQKMLTFVVAGAGFTGIEMAGELLEWRDVMAEKWLIDKKSIRIVIVEAMPHILPIFEEDLRDKIAAYLKKHDVELMTGTAITGADPGVVNLKTGANIETGTFIWTAGVTGNSFAGSLGLAEGPFGKQVPDGKRNRQGRLLVTDEMRSVDYPDVFPVGDNLWFVEADKPLPQIVETALQTGKTAADNITAAIEGKPAQKFKSDYHGFMVSVGGKYAVSNAMNIKLSGLFAQAMKHIVNLHYLIGVAGINQCWEYIKHEFLDIENHRSIVHGFGAYKNRGYWALPLRLWIGLMWVFEGINKIGEGWLAWSTGTKSSWMFSPWIVQAGGQASASAASGAADAATTAASAATTAASGAVDAATAASGAVGGAVSGAASQFKDVWDFTKPIFDSQGAIATWFRTTFMDSIMSHIPFQGFQLMVVLVEICVGLCLIGGLFTWLAAAVSIVMCLIFTFSGMFEWYKVWFIFTGFLLLGGAGRAFGLDCWVVPLFKKWWNGTKLARRLYLYFDNPSKSGKK